MYMSPFSLSLSLSLSLDGLDVLAGALIKSVNFAGVGCPIESEGATIIAGGEERLAAALPMQWRK